MFTASHNGTDCPCKRIPMCLSSFTAAEFGDIHSLSMRFADDRTPVDSAGNSPLHLAAQHGHTAAVAFLLRRYDVNFASGGATALHRASFSGATTTMKLLLEEPHCDLLAQDTSFGDNATPLHKACAGGRYLAVQLLLEALAHRGQVEIALSTRNATGETPMDVIHAKLRNCEEEGRSVARWNSVADHRPDWERCESILKRFQIMPKESVRDPIPDALRNGSLCRPGQDCKDGLCSTRSWENAFRATLMGRVAASTCPEIAAKQTSEGELTTMGTKQQQCTNIESFSTATTNPSEEEAIEDSIYGRSCGWCQLKSIVLYRRSGKLVCQQCAK